MSKPNQFLQDIYHGLEPDHIGALALVYQMGDLPVPLEVQSSERRDLLTLVGSSISGAAGALEILEGTFLRRARKMGTEDAQEYWSFRHPTLREGYATFVASKPNLLRLFIEGLDDNGILTQLDCGGDEKRGTLVLVPSSLYPMVVQRVANARPASRHGDDDWQKWRLWTSFFANRCSRGFFDVYIGIDPELVNRCLNVHSYLSATPELPVLARLHTLGLLPEEARRTVRDTVSDLAVETPDSDWVNNKGIEVLLTDQERNAIFDRVCSEFLPTIEGTIEDWRWNEQGESADEYYDPLIDALDSYKKAFDERGNKVAVAAFTKALDEVFHLRENASYWQDKELDEPPPARSRLSELLAKDTSSFSAGTGDRSVFDDVDE